MKSLNSRNLLLATLKLFSPQISRKWNGVLVPNNMCPLCILPRFMSGGGLELPRSRSAGNWAWFTQLGGVVPTLRKQHPARSGHKAFFVGFPSCSLLSGLSTKFLWVKPKIITVCFPGNANGLVTFVAAVGSREERKPCIQRVRKNVRFRLALCQKTNFTAHLCSPY